MRRKIGLAVAVVAAVVATFAVAIQPAYAAVGIHISNGRLVEANGTPLKLRGINHAHTWFTNQTSSFANIKAAGANSVRVVLSGGRWTANSASDVANVISLCKTNKLICVLEDHDTTGYGEQSGAVTLDAAVNYWISVQSALTGQESYVILNIGNEPFGNNATTPGWADATRSAITRLRNAGFQHTIMVDAPNWGQDWQFTMRDNAPSVLAADTTGNTIFSIHMYGVFDTAAEVTAYVDSFTSRNLPLCICEFGNMHSDGDPDEDTIMAKAQSAGIGMMGWSWSGNSGGVEYLDMVTNFDPAQRTAWGTRYITGANGLSTTSTEATIYSGGTGDTQAPTVPGTPTTSNVTSSAVTLSWSASSDNVGVTGYDIYRAPGASGGTFASVGTATGTTFTNTGLTAATTYRYQVRARDAAGNTSAFSPAVTVTTATGGGTGGCTATYSLANSWPGGFQGGVTVTNTGTTATTGWTVVLTFADGQRITQIWAARTSSTASPYTVTNETYNGALGAGTSTTFGFLASWSNTNSAPTVTCTRTP
jgi:mannan endo-1,4-beta-mannosidase